MNDSSNSKDTMQHIVEQVPDDMYILPGRWAAYVYGWIISDFDRQFMVN